MSWIFVCDREGNCRLGRRNSSGVPRINVQRHGRTPESAGRAAAREFLAANSRYVQVETTVDEDAVSA